MRLLLTEHTIRQGLSWGDDGQRKCDDCLSHRTASNFWSRLLLGVGPKEGVEWHSGSCDLRPNAGLREFEIQNGTMQLTCCPYVKIPRTGVDVPPTHEKDSSNWELRERLRRHRRCYVDSDKQGSTASEGLDVVDKDDKSPHRVGLRDPTGLAHLRAGYITSLLCSPPKRAWVPDG